MGEEIDAHRIRTVLNLRGPNPTDGWYQDEVATTRAHGAALYDVGISAQEPVAPEKIEKILAVLRDAPKPILVHCRSGSDRAGFVSALSATPLKDRVRKWQCANYRCARAFSVSDEQKRRYG